MSGQWDMACDWKWYAPLTSPAHKYLWFKVFYALSPHSPPWKSHVKDGQVRRWKDPGLWMIGQKLSTHQIHSFGFYMGETQPSTGVSQILEFLSYQWWTWLSFIWLNWQVVLKSGQEHGLWCQIDLSLSPCSASLGHANSGKLLNLSETQFSYLWKEGDNAYLPQCSWNWFECVGGSCSPVPILRHQMGVLQFN